MPAVELAQLRIQVDKLIWTYTRPPQFLKMLHELLELYSSRGIYRPGITIHPIRQISTYHTSPLIIKEIEKQLGRQIKENPDAALKLAEELWKDNFKECKELAAFMVGSAPINSPEIILKLITAWAVPAEQAYSISSLLETGTLSLRQHNSDLYMDLITQWIESSQSGYNKIGIEALTILVKDKNFIDIPRIYSMIAPLIRKVPPHLQGELKTLLRSLIERSPSETSYFLKQSILISPNTETKRLLRKVINDLPPDLRVKLRDLVNNPDLSL